jgi:hypothetical protein
MKEINFNLYADYLLSTFGAATATDLSAMVEGQVSHDQVTRFLSAREYTFKDLWLQVKSFSGAALCRGGLQNMPNAGVAAGAGGDSMKMIEQMLGRYPIEARNDALREVMQEIALAGLQRAGFFDKAAFYGGTYWRIFHDLLRLTP